MTALVLVSLLGQFPQTGIGGGWPVVPDPTSTPAPLPLLPGVKFQPPAPTPPPTVAPIPQAPAGAAAVPVPVGCEEPGVGMQINQGTPVTPRARQALAVVRLRTEDFACTATIVAAFNHTYLLSAAHCFVEFADNAMVAIARWAIVSVGNGNAMRDYLTATEGLLLPPAFRACVARGDTYAACIASADDLALLPISIDGLIEEGDPIRAWRVSRSRTAPPAIALLGYGLDRGVPSPELLGAVFGPSGPAPAQGPAPFQPVEDFQQVASGDSGGPGISTDEVISLGTRLPCIWYVSSGLNLATGTAMLQPVAIQPGVLAP